MIDMERLQADILIIGMGGAVIDAGGRISLGRLFCAGKTRAGYMAPTAGRKRSSRFFSVIIV